MNKRHDNTGGRVLRRIMEGIEQNTKCEQSFEIPVCRRTRGLGGRYPRQGKQHERRCGGRCHSPSWGRLSGLLCYKIRHMEILSKYMLKEQILVKDTTQSSWTGLGVWGAQHFGGGGEFALNLSVAVFSHLWNNQWDSGGQWMGTRWPSSTWASGLCLFLQSALLGGHWDVCFIHTFGHQTLPGKSYLYW